MAAALSGVELTLQGKCHPQRKPTSQEGEAKSPLAETIMKSLCATELSEARALALLRDKAEVDVFFWNSLALCMIQWMFGNLISASSPFSKSSLNVWKFMVHVLLKPGEF